VSQHSNHDGLSLEAHWAGEAYQPTPDDWADYRDHLDSLPEEERCGQCFPDDPEPLPGPGGQGSVLYRLPDGRPAVYRDGEG
jgi:hypothetical protein